MYVHSRPAMANTTTLKHRPNTNQFLSWLNDEGGKILREFKNLKVKLENFCLLNSNIKSWKAQEQEKVQKLVRKCNSVKTKSFMPSTDPSKFTLKVENKILKELSAGSC